MIDVFLKTLPFFLIIGLGYGAGRTRFFPEEATAYLTKFVFYFALSAMLFRFSADLSIGELFNWRFVIAYLWASFFVWGIATAVSFLAGKPVTEAAVEAQCAVIGNVGFLGVPMLALLMGPAAIGPLMMVLAMDLIVFGSIIVVLITTAKGGKSGLAAARIALLGLIRNPMIVAITLGLVWSTFQLPRPAPLMELVSILGAAATPGALFAIGASLASKSTERLSTAIWLSFAKLVLHPAFVAFGALILFPVEPFQASVMIACAAFPVAGNIYILAQHYGVAPQRVSASILVSTVFAVATIPLVVSWVSQLN